MRLKTGILPRFARLNKGHQIKSKKGGCLFMCIVFVGFWVQKWSSSADISPPPDRYFIFFLEGSPIVSPGTHFIVAKG